MNPSFTEQLRVLYRKIRIRVQIALPSLLRAAAGIVREMGQMVILCAAALTMCGLAAQIGSVSTLMNLFSLLLLTPAVCAVMTYASDASWERRHITIQDVFHLVRIRAKQIFITGAAAWLIITLAKSIIGMLLMVISVLLGGVFALLCMIPVLGSIVAAIAAAVQWMIMLLTEYACHVALTVGMMALLADGISGRAQLDRAMEVLRMGGRKLIELLIMLFGVWIAVGGIAELLGLVAPAAKIVVNSLLTVCSMAAVSVIYLRQRDGVDFR